ncbi:hypothetical protein A374_19460 [Fictibacillus macauensis ZFHKF-1]|uniref:Uncharacterized protein n=1 Tax=Fictibacillus macauensis ZFHKF-1 TaxID=1196324 RepID=I8U9L5_9BACL|nr:hypothetical protein [Fictibacillus macauensis]EIT83640.1 hypothetical protein A374_19460 [Fictibacillus macauensis ZFHKF-1]
MSDQKLTIVPVTLHPEMETAQSPLSLTTPSTSIFSIQTAHATISFYNGVNESIIQTVMRELKTMGSRTEKPSGKLLPPSARPYYSAHVQLPN